MNVIFLDTLLVPAPLILPKEKSEFDAIWAGTYTTFARRASKGDIVVWGLNNYQQIGEYCVIRNIVFITS